MLKQLINTDHSVKLRINRDCPSYSEFIKTITDTKYQLLTKSNWFRDYVFAIHSMYYIQRTGDEWFNSCEVIMNISPMNCRKNRMPGSFFYDYSGWLQMNRNLQG